MTHGKARKTIKQNETRIVWPRSLRDLAVASNLLLFGSPQGRRIQMFLRITDLVLGEMAETDEVSLMSYGMEQSSDKTT
jgi:hypothetical protein